MRISIYRLNESGGLHLYWYHYERSLEITLWRINIIIQFGGERGIPKTEV